MNVPHLPRPRRDLIPNTPHHADQRPGTCVNVGCVPKKICHYGGLLGEAMKDARKLGWKLPAETELEVRVCGECVVWLGGGEPGAAYMTNTRHTQTKQTNSTTGRAWRPRCGTTGACLTSSTAGGSSPPAYVCLVFQCVAL